MFLTECLENERRVTLETSTTINYEVTCAVVQPASTFETETSLHSRYHPEIRTADFEELQETAKTPAPARQVPVWLGVLTAM